MRRRELVWAATVGVVLADSSVVTLALPDILRELDTSVIAVSWVLTSFNVVLALAVLPAAYVVAARGGPERVWVGGALAFGVASLVCALAPGLGLLLVGRSLQALGGAFVIAGAIELLARSRGSHASAAAVWGAAGLAGLAIGPAAGGLLTELLAWEAISSSRCRCWRRRPWRGSHRATLPSGGGRGGSISPPRSRWRSYRPGSPARCSCWWCCSPRAGGTRRSRRR